MNLKGIALIGAVVSACALPVACDLSGYAQPTDEPGNAAGAGGSSTGLDEGGSAGGGSRNLDASSSVGSGGGVRAGGSGGRSGTGATAEAGTGGAGASAGNGTTSTDGGATTGTGDSGAQGDYPDASGFDGSDGAGGSAGTAPISGPCDIYASGNTPCVAAHSLVRALFGAYAGNLYQVRRQSDNTTKDIRVLAAGGFADAAAQDAFCLGTTCTISIIYDQSPKGNHLTKAPGGGAVRTPDAEVTANRFRSTVGGHPVYAAYFEGGMGYRNDRTSGVATGDQPQSMYMVTSGTHFNNGCCFDYGNAETDNNDDGAGAMEAIYFGNATFQGKGAGNGPWVMADLENGLFGGLTFAANPTNTPLTSEFVTAVVKGKAGGFTLKGGDAQSEALKTMYDGPRPNGYNPMKKQGAIILGIGGDNSNHTVGVFFEGCMTVGYASDAVDSAVQANIVAAGFGH